METYDVYEDRNCLSCKYRLHCLNLIVPNGKCPFHLFDKWETNGEDVEENIQRWREGVD
jgi:hypothetical protein